MSTKNKPIFIPVKFYEDAEKSKSTIKLENKDKSGIYKWENKISGEYYIGSAVDLGKRIGEYFHPSYLMHPSRGKSIICFALVKYSHKNFSVSILEYSPRDKLMEREQFYLDQLNPPYNILKYAYSSEGYKHTLEAIKKMSLTKKGKFMKEQNSFYNRTHTEEVKKLLSEAALKRTKPNNAKPVFLKDSNNKIIGDFKSMTELSLYLKADKATLKRYRDSSQLFRDLYYVVSKPNQ